ncbi:MAG: hypothetical protein K2X35_19405 [Bryobacteraceae bacterium]|nr:hypothetical protein [Bryobacteraceae bacterium]
MKTDTLFTIAQAAKLFDMTAAEVRNFIARGHVRQFGVGRGGGREREFGRLGLYELGIVRRLADHGLTYEAANRVVSSGLAKEKAVRAFTMIGQHNMVPEKAFQALENDPDLILANAPWNWRDLTNPFLWVFIVSHEGLFGPKLAEGWDDIGPVAREVVAFDSRLLPSVGLGASAPTMPKLDDHHWEIFRPVIHVFNLTATLVGIDQKIESLAA